MRNEYKKFNCYKILEIEPNATSDDIKSAFKKASLKYHPDVGGSHEKQVEIGIARDILLNPTIRNYHDKYWGIVSNFQNSPPPISKKQNRPSASYDKQRPKSNSSSSSRGQNKTYYSGEKKHTTYNQKSPEDFLKNFKNRILKKLIDEQKRIWGEIEYRKDSFELYYKEILSKERKTAISLFSFIVFLSFVSYFANLWWLWVLVAYLSLSLVAKFLGVQLGENTYSILNFDLSLLREYANEAAKKSCEKDTADLQKYNIIMEYISTLISHPTTLNDSEIETACRLVVSFFVKGYIPVSFDKENRIIRFKYQEAETLVRFRHRSGSPLNISYIEKLVEQMNLYGIEKGAIFSSTGFSSSAKKYAINHKVQYYSYLEELNKWVSESVYTNIGPEGDILRHLQDLRLFIDVMKTPQVSKPSRYYRYRRYR
jgi:hypothetical protein